MAFQPAILSFDALLVRFWEAHDPTQGNRQGNDIGTQYRSAIYVDNDEMLAVARRSAKHYGQRLAAKGFGGITTEIKTDPAHFIMLKTITSNICIKSQMAIAGWQGVMCATRRKGAARVSHVAHVAG